MHRICAALVLFGACWLGGCGPVVAWHGQSPDGAHRAVVLEVEGGQRLVLDEQELGAWDAIAVSHLAWTVRGPVVPVRSGERWHVLDAGTLGPAHDAIGLLLVEDDHVVYAALDEDGWRVVRDGQQDPPFESIRARSLALAESHVAYSARDASGEHAVIDGLVGPAFAHVEGLGFAGKGQLSIYAAYDETGARLVVDGAPGPSWGDVLELALAADEPRWAAIAEQEERFSVLHDGRSVGDHESATGLVISADGTRVAWQTPTEDRVSLWVDGEAAGTHARVADVRFVPGSNELVYVAEEEDGARVVHRGSAGPRFDTIDPIVTSDAGHWGYAGHRHGVGSAIVVDGVLRFRGEWGGRLTLASRASTWAFVERRAGRRFVVTSERRVEIARPFVDTLVLAADGQHWAIAVAELSARRLRVVVDGEDVAPLEIDEVAAEVSRGHDSETATRVIVARELARARD